MYFREENIFGEEILQLINLFGDIYYSQVFLKDASVQKLEIIKYF